MSIRRHPGWPSARVVPTALAATVMLAAAAACQSTAGTAAVPTAVATALATGTPAPSPVTSGATPFSPQRFDIPLSIRFGPEWRVDRDDQDELELIGGTTAYEGIELTLIDVKNAKVDDPEGATMEPWPKDFVAYLKSNPYLTTGEPSPISVGGVPGTQVDVSIAAIGQSRVMIETAVDAWLYIDYDQNWRFEIFDDVHGERLVIGITEYPAGFATATQLAQPVIDSIQFPS